MDFFKKDASLITEFLPNLAYFITDFYEKLYDDSLATLSNPTPANATSSLLTSPTTSILNAQNNLTTPPGNSNNSQALSLSSKTSPPIVLKISTRFEIRQKRNGLN